MNQIQLRLQQAQVIGILRTTSAETAVEAALSAVRAGLEVLELTFTTPAVMSALSALRKDLPSHVLLGVGSVITLNKPNKPVPPNSILWSAHTSTRNCLISPKLPKYRTFQGC